jgi:hypothetical protein
MTVRRIVIVADPATVALPVVPTLAPASLRSHADYGTTIRGEYLASILPPCPPTRPPGEPLDKPLWSDGETRVVIRSAYCRRATR